MNAQQLIKQQQDAHAEYERTTVGMRDENGDSWTIAHLRTVFDKHTDGANWKAPVSVTLDCTTDDVVGFCRAVEFFQGDRPKVHNAGTPTTVLVTSRGYQG